MISLRPILYSLVQLKYVEWQGESVQAYQHLRDACERARVARMTKQAATASATMPAIPSL